MTHAIGRSVKALAAFLLLLGPVVGVIAYRAAVQEERHQARDEFDDYLSDRIDVLETEMATLVEALESLKSFYDCSEVVTRDEFARFTSGILRRHSPVQAMEWIPGVSGGESLEHGPAPGHDFASEPVREAALRRAVATGEAALTDPVELVQGGGESPGLLLLLALGRNALSGAGSPLADDGLVLMVLRVEEILRPLAGTGSDRDCPRRSTMLEFDLVDADASQPLRTLGRTAGYGSGRAAADPPSRREIVTAGQTWILSAHPTDAFMAARLTARPVALGVGAALLWELLWIALIAVSRWSRSMLLNRQNRLTRAVIGGMTEGIAVADADGVIVMANPAAERLLGIVAGDVLDEGWALKHRCLRPDRETPYSLEELPLRRAIRGENLHGETVYVGGRGDGAGIWINIDGKPLAGVSGERQGGMIVFRDISSRKRSSEVVKRLLNAVEHTDDLVFITDREGLIQYVNEAFVRATGYTREEAVGRTPRLLKSNRQDPAHYADLWRTITAGGVFRKMIVNRRKNGEMFQADQTITPMRDMSGAITHFVSVAKDMTETLRMERSEAEMELASRVQRKLYPQQPPRIAGLDVAGAVLSADATCGDYFDYLEMPDGHLGIAVGDVSGHGIGSAMVMAQVRAYLRSLAETCKAPERILERINRVLFADLERHRFVTLILAFIDPGTRRLSYASAGHEPGYIIGADGELKAELSSTGLPLGILERSDFAAGAGRALEPGDVLLLVTDGLTESQAHEDRFLDAADFLAVVREHRRSPAAEIVERLREKVDAFAQGRPRNDDITIVVCRAE